MPRVGTVKAGTATLTLLFADPELHLRMVKFFFQQIVAKQHHSHAPRCGFLDKLLPNSGRNKEKMWVEKTAKQNSTIEMEGKRNPVGYREM